eukprot:GEMP01004443.1.p1 GENE.GEMP01004443.1~~GEMP01004443.1.p1  ORF type:complete len:1137 (-),score=63.03 GEMP01004443.1:624-4034(-)
MTMLNLCLLGAVIAYEVRMSASDTSTPNMNTSVLLGVGLCRSASRSEIQSVTGDDAKEFLTNATCVQDCESSVTPCTGYAIGPDHCVIYFKQPLQAVRQISSLRKKKSRCYASSVRYSSDWPIRSVSSEDFLKCFNMVKADGSRLRASEYKNYMHEEIMDGGFSTITCSHRCQLYSHFGLKKFDERKKCFCIDRYDYTVEPPLDRFTTDAFGHSDLLNHCPAMGCDYTNAGCNWGRDSHIAIYRSPLPTDGDECPDSLLSHDHESRFMYISGTNELDLNKHGAYSHTRVDSPRKCADLCYKQGSYFRGGNEPLYNEVCHAYFSHREREAVELVNFDCYLFNDPILAYRTHKKLSGSHADKLHKMNHMCVLRTCIEDTPCAIGYQRQSGFKYTKKDISTRRIDLTDQKITHCSACAVQCELSADCKAYQCSISLNHCYLFTSLHVDSTLQVSDVSFCGKIPETKCRSSSGVLQVGQHEDGCLCGRDTICYAGKNCYVAEGSTEYGECLEPCPCAGPNPKEGFEICSTSNQTWVSECHAKCANATKDYDGPCRPPSPGCNFDVLVGGASQLQSPCNCLSAGVTNTYEAVLCPIGSTCFTNGTCGPSSCMDLEPNTSGDNLVCASDGITYTSVCHILSPDGNGNPVTVVGSGTCPLEKCKDGQTNCDNCQTSLASGNSECRSYMGTQCVVQCNETDLVANTCGCVSPCRSVTTLSSTTEQCGCQTNVGYVVCDGYCYLSTNEVEPKAECMKGCPASDPCLCHDHVCNEDEICDTKETPHQCASICLTPHDTDCVCTDAPVNKTKSILHCPATQNNSRMVCSTTIDNSTAAECLPRCKTMVKEVCICGSLSSPIICAPDLECSEEGDDGTCGPQCLNGETNCVCDDQFCVNDSVSSNPTYCNKNLDPSVCLPSCETDEWQTDCYCPDVNAWKAQNNSSMVCSSHSYCNANSSAPASETAVCKPGCEQVDGLVAVPQGGCPCGTGEFCETGQYCSHTNITGILITKCYDKVINETCLPNYEGSLEDACLCGGYHCPEGFFCDLSSGTCSENQIVDCMTSTSSCVTDACFCGPSRMLCTPGDQCIGLDGNLECHSPVERCHSAPPLAGTKTTNCMCGKDGDPCMGVDNHCSSPRWNDTCQAV